MRRISVVFFVALLLLGCSAPKSDVSGKVTLAGRTVQSGTVVFVDQTNQPYSGDIQSDGSYTVKGVPAGPVKIYVYSPSGASGSSLRTGKAAPSTPPPGWFELPAKYADPDTSGLETTISSGSMTHNIDLK